MDEITSIKVTMDPQGRLVADVRGVDAMRGDVTAKYRTDRDHCGLWEWSRDRCDWVQIIGTGQYSARSVSAFRSKIRRMLTWR